MPKKQKHIHIFKTIGFVNYEIDKPYYLYQCIECKEIKFDW